MVEVDIYFLDPFGTTSNIAYQADFFFDYIQNTCSLLLYLVKVCKYGKVGITGTDHSDYLMNRDM